jgi:hypothetical protein
MFINEIALPVYTCRIFSFICMHRKSNGYNQLYYFLNNEDDEEKSDLFGIACLML